MTEQTPILTERQAAHEAVRAMRRRLAQVDDKALDLLFLQARSHYGWTDKPVPEALLRRLYELVRMAPTANNGNPARFVFVVSPEAKAKLGECVGPGNAPKVAAAPVTAIIAYDPEFWRKLDKLEPHRTDGDRFAGDPERAEKIAFRNSSLQGAFLILAARALGLDTGPMSGFSNAKVDEAFLAGTSFKSNFLCNLGYADETAIFQRLPRLDFEEACRIA